MKPYDARAVANLILDEAELKGHRLTNLSVQKLLYFSHGLFLIRQGRPLVSGYFEAWKYGPVHPAAYAAFKAAGDQFISFRARKFDLVTQTFFSIEKVENPECKNTISRVLDAYGGLSSGRLVELSHAPNAPWAHVVDNSQVRPMLGLRITDNIIRERFRFHKISIGHRPVSGDPNEDAPFA